jgi:hypothetical protein
MLGPHCCAWEPPRAHTTCIRLLLVKLNSMTYYSWWSTSPRRLGGDWSSMITPDDLLMTWLDGYARPWGIHHVREAKDHLIVSTWFLWGPRGSNTLTGVLQRGLVESVDSSIPREILEESSCPYFTFCIYFEHFTLCICFSSICHNGFGLLSISYSLLFASRLGEVGLLFRV